MSLPFLFSRLDMGPATASDPLVTSIADVVIYFSIASDILLNVSDHASGTCLTLSPPTLYLTEHSIIIREEDFSCVHF